MLWQNQNILNGLMLFHNIEEVPDSLCLENFKLYELITIFDNKDCSDNCKNTCSMEIVTIGNKVETVMIEFMLTVMMLIVMMVMVLVMMLMIGVVVN